MKLGNLNCFEQTRIGILFCLFCLTTNCATDNHKPNSGEQTNTIKPSLENDKGFDLSFHVNPKADSNYDFLIDLKLDSGNYIISPFSKDNFYMPFSLVLDKNTHLHIDQAILEIPKSKIELDTIINLPVRFIRTNTQFIQKVNVRTSDDFEVLGKVEFLIEPSCIPYSIDFMISQQDGKMAIKKTKTGFHPSYRGK